MNFLVETVLKWSASEIHDVWKMKSGWWFQPIWKSISQIRGFPKWTWKTCQITSQNSTCLLGGRYNFFRTTFAVKNVGGKDFVVQHFVQADFRLNMLMNPMDGHDKSWVEFVVWRWFQQNHEPSLGMSKILPWTSGKKTQKATSKWYLNESLPKAYQWFRSTEGNLSDLFFLIKKLVFFGNQKIWAPPFFWKKISGAP